MTNSMAFSFGWKVILFLFKFTALAAILIGEIVVLLGACYNIENKLVAPKKVNLKEPSYFKF